MLQPSNDRSGLGTRAATTARSRRFPLHRLLALAALLLAVLLLSSAAHAQLGALKRLKNAVSPDSAAKVAAAVRDSTALAAKRAAGDTTPLQRSKLQQAVAAANAGATKFEEVTGVSAKDAALVASGAGAGAVIAKKAGVTDVKTTGAQIIGKAAAKRAASKAADAAVGAVGTAGVPGDMAALMRMQQQAAAQMPNAPMPGVGGPAMLGLTSTDARALALFQQEMMQVAMAASAGDLGAQARLQRWEAIALKHQPEIERLTMTASAGDFAAMQRLQAIQLNIIREWANTGSARAVVPGRAPKAKKAVKP